MDHTIALELKKRKKRKEITENSETFMHLQTNVVFISRGRLYFSINMFRKQLYVGYVTFETLINHTTKTVTFYTFIMLAVYLFVCFGLNTVIEKNRFFMYARCLIFEYVFYATHITAN